MLHETPNIYTLQLNTPTPEIFIYQFWAYKTRNCFNYIDKPIHHPCGSLLTKEICSPLGNVRNAKDANNNT